MPPIERFWRCVREGPGCWTWTGRLFRNGYGQFKMFGKYFLAHRLAYLLHNESLPSDLCVCHSCDVRNCVTPAHLFLGTNEDNLKDMAAKNRGRGPSKVTEIDVKRIRNLLATGATQQAVGDLFGLHQSTISDIHNNKIWRYV